MGSGDNYMPSNLGRVSVLCGKFGSQARKQSKGNVKCRLVPDIVFCSLYIVDDMEPNKHTKPKKQLKVTTKKTRQLLASEGLENTYWGKRIVWACRRKVFLLGWKSFTNNDLKTVLDGNSKVSIGDNMVMNALWLRFSLSVLTNNPHQAAVDLIKLNEYMAKIAQNGETVNIKYTRFNEFGVPFNI